MDPQLANPEEITSPAQTEAHQRMEKKLMVTTITIIRKSMNNKQCQDKKKYGAGKTQL